MVIFSPGVMKNEPDFESWYTNSNSCPAITFTFELTPVRKVLDEPYQRGDPEPYRNPGKP